MTASHLLRGICLLAGLAPGKEKEGRRGCEVFLKSLLVFGRSLWGYLRMAGCQDGRVVGGFDADGSHKVTHGSN